MARLRRRAWIVFAAVMLLAISALADVALARRPCVAARDGGFTTAAPCCAQSAASEQQADAGAALCAVHCGGAGCALAIAPYGLAAIREGSAFLGAASAVAYAGWRPPIGAPPPRSIILA